MKTIKEWVDTLPTDIREMAYINTKIDVLKNKGLEPSLYKGISGAFIWDLTPEKHMFWSLVAKGQFDEARQLLTDNTTKP